MPGITNRVQWQLPIPQKGEESVFLNAIILLFYTHHLITAPPHSFHTASGADKEMTGIDGYHKP